MERYALYTVRRDGQVLRGEIHHPPWTLRAAELELERETAVAAAGLPAPRGPALLHHAETQHTLAWLPRPAEG